MKFLNSFSPKVIIFIVSLYLFGLNSCNQNYTKKKLSLNEEWEFYFEKTEKWYPATVPGNIHTDLFKNNLIPNPFLENNADSLAWVSNQTWKYRKSFDISSDFINRNIELVFDGLDTHAEVFLNGTKLGNANNMFKPWVFIIDNSLKKEKNNLIEIIFRPSSEYNKLKEDQGAYSIPDNHGNTRKSPYQYGWDWAPNMETCGIYKDVYLRTWEKMRIVNVNIEQKFINDTLAILQANIKLESEKFYNGKITISSPNNEFDSITQKLDINEGENFYHIEFQIDNPELWWCNGMGEQKLYDVNIQISTKFRIEECSKKIGLRKIDFVSELDEEGQSFYFKLNDIPIFIRGANWIPAEYFSGSNSYDNYKELISLAKEANFNMLRVWGGGIYENDDFYDICDSLGIMVWQDFMFACAMYPLDEEMKNNISEEVKYQANRLYNHPSVVFYCGNNEISNGWFDWNWQKEFNLSKEDSLKIWNDYDNLFHRLIPEALAKVDKTRKYIPSSPFFGWGRPESLTHGDSHYWGVWWGMLDFEMFFEKTARFMSEYGFQAFPSIESMQKFINKDSLYLYSEPLKSHQKHRFGFEAIDKYMYKYYKIPENFEDYVYMSQFLQAEGIQMAFDAHLTAMPYCMGTLFWQFNDCWPVISWSAVDYYKQTKALYYYAKRSFENLSLSIYKKDENLNFYAINHSQKKINSLAKLEVKTFDGKVIYADSLYVNLTKSTVQKIDFDIFLENILDTLSNNELRFIEFTLSDSLSKDLLCSKTYVENFESLASSQGNFEYFLEKQEDFWQISINSNYFIKALQITAKENGSFSDNWLDIIPGKTAILRFYPKDRNIQNLRLSFNSVNDILSREFAEVSNFQN
ncbi:MAG: glycoside hydrolase family 2 protein [Bacteroidales bacterium]|jgi:beta-mannosidase|nr:glycoside hydrolase family 2 protein [Bacteroidales bacterium]NLB86431.1 glycoside hydrolase family 2 protein [Bacteroidales bacterium]